MASTSQPTAGVASSSPSPISEKRTPLTEQIAGILRDRFCDNLHDQADAIIDAIGEHLRTHDGMTLDWRMSAALDDHLDGGAIIHDGDPVARVLPACTQCGRDVPGEHCQFCALINLGRVLAGGKS